MLESLLHFKAHWFSLSRSHMIVTAAGSPYEVSRAAIVLLMLLEAMLVQNSAH